MFINNNAVNNNSLNPNSLPTSHVSQIMSTTVLVPKQISVNEKCLLAISNSLFKFLLENILFCVLWYSEGVDTGGSCWQQGIICNNTEKMGVHTLV